MCSGLHKPDQVWQSAQYYGDASGGKVIDIPALRRVAIGIAHYNDENAFQFGFQAPSCGLIQTVARGEAYALLLVVTSVVPDAHVTFFTDCYSVYTTYQKVVGLAHKSLNFDVWYTIVAAIKAKGIKVLLLWMPSHLDASDNKKPKPEWVQEHHIAGNKEADDLADKAAEYFTLPSEIWYPIISNMKKITLIQRRLVYIICNLPHRAKT